METSPVLRRRKAYDLQEHFSKGAGIRVYTLNNNIVDVGILWCVGRIGFGMRTLDVPVAPCIVVLILGPLAEQQFRRALTISQGDATIFVTHPISLGLFTLTAVLVIVPLILRHRAARTAAPVPSEI